jgi:hypothetical protein
MHLDKMSNTSKYVFSTNSPVPPSIAKQTVALIHSHKYLLNIHGQWKDRHFCILLPGEQRCRVEETPGIYFVYVSASMAT